MKLIEAVLFKFFASIYRFPKIQIVLVPVMNYTSGIYQFHIILRARFVAISGLVSEVHCTTVCLHCYDKEISDDLFGDSPYLLHKYRSTYGLP